MRSLTVISLILVLAFCLGGSSSADSTNKDRVPEDLPDKVDLKIKPVHQECNEWNWAAVSQMVANYYDIYGEQINQCTLASIKGNVFDTRDRPICCLKGPDRPGCGISATSSEMMSIFAGPLRLTGYFLEGTLSERDLMRELANGRPVIIELGGSFEGYHIVIHGYRLYEGVVFFEYFDPAFGNDWATHRMLRLKYRGSKAKWTNTWHKLTPKKSK